MIKMTPDLAFAFPLVMSGKDVSVPYPVMLNPSTILKPGGVLRTMYILNFRGADDGTSDLALAHKGNMEQSFTRATMSDDEKSKMPPELSHELEGYRRTVWPVIMNFQLALAQMPTDRLHLIYTPTGMTKDMIDDKLSLLDGMLIGEPDGHVTVLGVENGGKADKAGIKANDQILNVGGTPIKGDDLPAFAAAYAAAKKAAKDNEASSFPITILSGGKGEPHTVEMEMPPTIKSGLMHGF